MNQHDAHDARLAQALGDLADARVPDYTSDVLARTRRSRQRPRWTFFERWFDMTTIAQRVPVARPLALIPRGMLVLLVLGLIITLTIAGASIGGHLRFSRAVLPAPVDGPAANGLIAFERDGDIHVIEPDGTDERPLIVAPGNQTIPAWSRDGMRIAYLSASDEDGSWDVMIANADGSTPSTVATGLIDPEFPGWTGLDWSPDGSALVFAWRTVASGEAPCTDTTTEIGRNCSWRIFRAATDGSTGAVSTGDTELDARSPAISPDGETIAFAGQHAASSTIRLYLMTADGSDVRQISASGGHGYSFVRPSWSPDGSQIAGAVGQPYFDVVLVQADGGGEMKLTDTPTDEDRPSFAADGSIGWYGEGEDPCCMQVREADGDRIALPGDVPTWSPDGSLAVTSKSFQSPDFIIVARDGTILATIPEAAWPSWQRRAP
jgi:Tol biopolymer transport system component